MEKKFTRRDFVKGGLILMGGGIVAALAHIFNRTPLQNVSTQLMNTEISTPLVPKESNPTSHLTSEPTFNPTPTPTQESQPQPSPSYTTLPGVIGAKFPGRVVQVHHNDVHTWNYSDLNYWDYVSQPVVDSMMDQGLMSLTGESNVTDAWHSLIPDYQSGQVVAIKVSFNNSYDDAGSIEMIDSIIEPVNAIIRGLNTLGVPNSSIVVYDSSRWLPTRFTSGCEYSGVLFRYTSHDPWGAGSSEVHFTPPGMSAFTQKLSDVPTQANYLINVPVMKLHGMAKLSLAMKNHYGSIERPKDLHQWSSLASPDFSIDYNPMVDINNNVHIRDKTVLTIGDGIFSAFKNNVGSFPQPWVTFGNQTPKSLFFSTDPVAIDCVMGDMLNADNIAFGAGEIKPDGFAYLSLAEAAGLGVYERGNPWKDNYSKIDFIKREL